MRLDEINEACDGDVLAAGEWEGEVDENLNNFWFSLLYDESLVGVKVVMKMGLGVSCLLFEGVKVRERTREKILLLCREKWMNELRYLAKSGF